MCWQKFRVLTLIAFLVIGVGCQEVEEKKWKEDGNDLFQFKNSSQTTEIENNSTTTPIPNDDDYDVTNETPDEENKTVFEEEKSTTTNPEWATLIPNNIDGLISVKDVFEKSMDVVKDELKGIGIIKDWLKEVAIVDDNETMVSEDYPYSTNNYIDIYDNYDEKEIEKSYVDSDLANEDNIGETEKTDKEMNERADIIEENNKEEKIDELTTEEVPVTTQQQINTTTDVIDVLEKDLNKLKEIEKNELKEKKERDEILKEMKKSLAALEGDNLDLVDISTTFSVVTEINFDTTTENNYKEEIFTTEVIGNTEFKSEVPEVTTALYVNATETIDATMTTQKYAQTTEEVKPINETTTQFEFANDTQTTDSYTNKINEETTIALIIDETTKTIITTENIQEIEFETTNSIEIESEIQETTTTDLNNKFIITESTESVEIIDEEDNIDIKIEIVKNIVTEEEIMSTTEAIISNEIETEENKGLLNTEFDQQKEISMDQETKDSNKTTVFKDNENVDDVVEYTTTYWQSAHHLVSEIVDEIIEDIKLDDVNHVLGPATKDYNSIDDDEEETAKNHEIKKLLDENIRANKFKIINTIEDKFFTIIEGPPKSEEQTELETNNESEKPENDNILDDFNDYIVTKNDDFDHTNLVTLTRDYDGYVCMNVTSMSIKISMDKENEIWIPSTARQYGECNPGIKDLNFTWRANPNVPGNNTIGFKLHNDFEECYVDEAALNIHNETFRVYKLDLHIEDPTVIKFNSKVTVTIYHPAIKIYPIEKYVSEEEFERQFAPVLSTKNALLIATAGIICATTSMVAIAIYVYRKYNSDTRIFKISVDK